MEEEPTDYAKEQEKAWKLSEDELRKRIKDLGYKAELKQAVKADLVDRYLKVLTKVTTVWLDPLFLQIQQKLKEQQSQQTKVSGKTSPKKQ